MEKCWKHSPEPDDGSTIVGLRLLPSPIPRLAHGGGGGLTVWILDGLNCVFGIPQTRGLNVAGKILLFYIRFHFISLVHVLETGI